MAKTRTYQELQRDLDQYMSELQSDALDVDQAIAVYEKATECIKELEAYLKKAELKIKKVTRV